MSAPESVTRRSLPHWYRPSSAYFVTYRLAGTVPAEVKRRWREEASRTTSPEGRLQGQKQYFARLDAYLDEGRDRTWLARPPLAALVRRSLYHHDGTRLHLIAYCVMPNHVHALLQPTEAEEAAGGRLSPLARIMHSVKGYTGTQGNRLLERSGPFWQDESYDHWVRDEEELRRIIDYIALNPVKAGLAAKPHEWLWCSAHDRYLLDGSECGWLPGAFTEDDLG